MAYEKMMQIAFDIVNCEDGAPTTNAFVSKIAELCDNGVISMAQHGNLMRFVADMV